jgi:RNA polymerase sigma factor (sigma-70 family)
MTARQIEPILQHLRWTALHPEASRLTDGRLLDRFIADGDPAAFEALVRRHGPMVLGVCRRVLRDPHDADDAFQATFLVLARKADSVWPRERVGNWLYGVGHRTALAAKAANARRRTRERPLADVPEPENRSSERGEDLHALLDEELARLPDKYRLSIVLCDLERRTRREVARQFRIPEGTLSSRLTTARKLLARRLARRGLTVPGGSLGLVLPSGLAWRVPMSLVKSTVGAATPVAAGHTTAAGAVSAPAALAEGVVRSMLFTKLKAALTVLVLGAVVLGGGLLARPGGAAQPAGQSPDAADQRPAAAAPADPRGGETRPRPIPPAPRAVADYKATFDATLTVLSDYFTLEDINRYEGRIDTFPALVKPDRPGAKGPAVRRRASVRITPGDDGRFAVDVRVFKEAERTDRSTYQPAQWKPIGRDTEFEQVILKRLKTVRQDGEPAADQRPRVVERDLRQYDLEVLLVKVSPDGRDFGKDGKGKILAEPRLITQEGLECCLRSGGQVAVPAVGKGAVEYLDVGLMFRARVVHVSGDRVRLETVFERTKLDRAGEKGAQVSGVILRSVAIVKLGEAVKLTEGKGPDQHWLRVRVVQVETIHSETRSAGTEGSDQPDDR